MPADDLRRAARIIGESKSLLCTVLQGFYQSHQATAAAVQVNNLVLLRGMLGRPGAGVLQMNGQPTAQNTRECGADGDLPGFRNWENADHIAELAGIWNVETDQIPHYGPPTPAMQIFRYAEQGSIKLLWVSGTNPAVSLPELSRIRDILTQERLFVIVQDLFLTETAHLADVVLPAATWGEKTGVFTNADRTVHLSEKAVEPPGEARPDLDIFLDFARRMDLRDKDGEPLVHWHDAGTAFEVWKHASAGRPCDYSGLSYELLRGGSGIQWPCTANAPHGTERLYTDGRFFAHPDTAETYGKDLVTGASVSVVEYRSLNPDGKAMLKAAEYLPPHELPDEAYPFQLTTGRTIYQFHTRTKTGRARQLNDAATQVRAELSYTTARPSALRRRPRRPGHLPRRHPRPRPRHRHPTRPGLRPVPLRVLGHHRSRSRRRARTRRQRTHPNRLGPGLQTTTVQNRRRLRTPRRRPGSILPRRTSCRCVCPGTPRRPAHSKPHVDGAEHLRAGSVSA